MSKESSMTGYANTSTNTVVESDCGSVGTTDHKGDASNCHFVEHTYVKKSTKFADRDIDTPALDAVESAGELVQPPTPHDGILHANTLIHIMWMQLLVVKLPENVLLAPLSMMEELVQLEKFTYDDFLHDLKCEVVAEVVLV
ncbi:uncharacterized protein PHALS_11278 [Plasmopara halstedii]|uniref:Uncharacterized protein n=1 Tax=Plasmopara halstedii TaxID=4781 RepID=A0A0P1AJQ6_PLAHL|nr:uncharacterized protein PHALS_11278 [Plasmopara halstedii]CEG41113.1 hypothetical protein PHALS_11278 [Plasmopara halstedii]|eukprot:XP_024577482.1 hypothetical protein PHALS_11278 [Plasmopara halstedii]